MRYVMKLRTIPTLFCVLAAVAMLPGCFEELLEGASLGPSCVDESEPISLWPPNHDFWTVTPEDCGFSEACGTDHLDVVFLRATSDEPVNGRGDGNTEPDIILDCDSAQLRAERQGPGDGRVYTLHWLATDAARNRTEGQCIVTVPHDQSGREAGDSGAAYTVEPDEECDTGPATEFIAGPPVTVSGLSPLADCESAAVFTDGETEPWLVVNPTNPDNMVGAWMQDATPVTRGHVAGVTFDGGATWESVVIPGISRCSGGDIEQASDPWLAFAANGDLYSAALSTNGPGVPGPSVISVNKSVDGGLTWSDPITVDRVDTPLFNDKESITADPEDPCTVYITWTRFKNFFVDASSMALVSRTTDCGETWTEPSVIVDSAVRTIGLQVLVMPDGSLRAFSVESPFPFRSGSLTVQQSTDQGDTWSEPVTIDVRRSSPFAPDFAALIRSGFQDVAVDRDTGHLYAVWEQLFVPATIFPLQVAFSSSTDGGLTWSTPIRVDQTPVSGSVLLEQAFTASVEVSDDGTIGVTYYNFENDIPGDSRSDSDHWFIHCNPELADCNVAESWSDAVRLTPQSFDYLLGVQFGGSLFLGDYVGLASSGSDFFAFFPVTTEDDPANVLFVPIRGQ